MFKESSEDLGWGEGEGRDRRAEMKAVRFSMVAGIGALGAGWVWVGGGVSWWLLVEVGATHTDGCCVGAERGDGRRAPRVRLGP